MELLPSTGSDGDAYDNVLAMSVIDLYKANYIRRGPFGARLLQMIGDGNYATGMWVE